MKLTNGNGRIKWRYWIPFVIVQNGILIGLSIYEPNYLIGFFTGAVVIDTLNILTERLREM